jgi:signal transduction histidine kinase
MLRNREIQMLLLAMSAITAVFTVVAYLYSPIASVFVLAASSSMMACYYVFTSWRYREIQRLSGFLRRISNGDYLLDVRDNREGELSLLKNEINKVTTMLSEHGSLLRTDKVRLTDAISDISHQLKTPLTSMMVMADLLSQTNLPAEKRTEFTRHIRVQLERIEWLISSLLKLSKLDAGTVAFKMEPICVKHLIQKALEPVVIPMDIKGLVVSIQGEDSVTFKGDLKWSAEALINILKNAVEHTEEGGRIDISFEENPLFTEIMIVDHGKGMDKEDLPHIFKRFYKGKNAGEGSIGIGLAMAHSIVNSQQGDIVVKSERGSGTQFRIKFYKQVI